MRSRRRTWGRAAARAWGRAWSFLALIVILPGVVPAGVAAQEGAPGEDPPSAECCSLLLVPVGARAMGMAGAYTARTGPDAVFRNPGGLAGLTGSMFLVHHSDMSLDVQVDAFTVLVTPFSSTFGLSYQLFDNGAITTTDQTGQVTGEQTLRDHLLVASFGTGLGAGVGAGVNLKLFQQRVDCTGSSCGGVTSVATTHAVDLGVRYSPTWARSLELGLAVVNLGPALHVENAEQADDLPARLHVGAAYDVLGLVQGDSTLALRVLLDVRDEVRDPGTLTPSIGMELDVQRSIFLRAGYTPGEGTGTGAAVGVGIRYERIDIAVARSFVNSILEADSEPFQVSFGLYF